MLVSRESGLIWRVGDWPSEVDGLSFGRVIWGAGDFIYGAGNDL